MAIGPVTNPIKHVVLIYVENHTFDSVLGRYCFVAKARGCDGAITGKLPDGTRRVLTDQPDIVPEVNHRGRDQIRAINGGTMDGWTEINGCRPTAEPGKEHSYPYGCYTQLARPNVEIPSMMKMVRQFAISDRTFQLGHTTSWHAHMALGAATLDGFAEDPGINPEQSLFTSQVGPGWGCNSFKDVVWSDGTFKRKVPSCVPDATGNGPYRTSPVAYVPTIMDRMDAAGVSWRIYDGDRSQGAKWAICPTFYNCANSSQRFKVVEDADFAVHAAKPTMPTVSIVIPHGSNSQHNVASMLQGDNWIASKVQAVMNGPNWNSTAIFITYDDCGCFYDHVPPPAGLGLRVPMVIVSPYAKAGYTDHNVASVVSMLAFIEHTFGLPPLQPSDATAYDYSQSFDYTQAPIPPLSFSVAMLPQWEARWLDTHPFDLEETDEETDE